jgi:hypothetical protein
LRDVRLRCCAASTLPATHTINSTTAAIRMVEV